MAVTIKLDTVLKRRVLKVARSVDKSPHAFMLAAIERETTRAEQRRSFVDEALQAEAEVNRDGMAIEATQAHRYLRAKIGGVRARRPVAKPLR